MVGNGSISDQSFQYIIKNIKTIIIITNKAVIKDDVMHKIIITVTLLRLLPRIPLVTIDDNR